MQELPFQEFTFGGHLGRRCVISFGSRHDAEAEALGEADDVPPFFLPRR